MLTEILYLKMALIFDKEFCRVTFIFSDEPFELTCHMMF